MEGHGDVLHSFVKVCNYTCYLLFYFLLCPFHLSSLWFPFIIFTVFALTPLPFLHYSLPRFPLWRGSQGRSKWEGSTYCKIILLFTTKSKLSIHPLRPYSVQSVGAAKAVSLAIGHNPGWVATPTQYTSKLVLILPTLEGWLAESTPPSIN